MAFHGAFVFRKQDHGILSSTYFNNGKDYEPYPETAKLKPDQDQTADPFIGVYDTTWLEKNAQYACEVEIQPFPGKKGVYKILWNASGKAPVPKYEGFGMLENGSLVGFYYY